MTRKYLISFSLLLMATQAFPQSTAKIKSWAADMLSDSAFQTAHTGIYIEDIQSGKTWFQYQGNKFFQPASNTKIITLFSALSFLGDSLPAARIWENDTAIWIKGTGDPSFLHPDFKDRQPLYQLLSTTAKHIYLVPAVNENTRFGPGWAWGDYPDYYQPERNELPMYGNIARINWHQGKYHIIPGFPVHIQSTPDSTENTYADRDERKNEFYLHYKKEDTSRFISDVPFITGDLQQVAFRLQDTLHKAVNTWHQANNIPAHGTGRLLHSRPLDSLLIPFMHHSDNFFAEQLLMMISAEQFDTIATARVIKKVKGELLNEFPQDPQWADGSGLSRYNLFSPMDFVYVLKKLYNQFPKERLFQIFATGGKGTLKYYFREAPNAVFAKTGTLNGCVALSGYLITRKGRTLAFSILVNNHHATSTQIRRGTEAFLVKIYQQY
ncbi:D-alanyl-D-alanine carboxypeptidase [Chitinophaga caeni]|uniref:D-alanyl-D-alanine carboxypeptidase n=1 Tax=Chitinophaga caeni TaxID=2029983 RepID=A0A291QRU6_9BACT|nr:D-alanyl-D-alanine carboxypeptidase [Chitinophaga caeni]ATL46667.1 D-alanyl-D-alanine carboxypeptidase [Chitinophaga caeni]